MQSVDHFGRANRWSVFAAGTKQQLLVGTLATLYGGTYLVLLGRGDGRSVLDVLAFACFAGIGVIGVANLVRARTALRDGSARTLWIICLGCGASWGYTSLAVADGISGGEAAFYGLMAAAALAAWIDSHRSGVRSRWTLIGPIAVFAGWSVAQALESALPCAVAAVSLALLSVIGVLAHDR